MRSIRPRTLEPGCCNLPLIPLPLPTGGGGMNEPGSCGAEDDVAYAPGHLAPPSARQPFFLISAPQPPTPLLPPWHIAAASRRPRPAPPTVDPIFSPPPPPREPRDDGPGAPRRRKRREERQQQINPLLFLFTPFSRSIPRRKHQTVVVVGLLAHNGLLQDPLCK